MSSKNIQSGYTRVGLTVPTPLAKRFRELSDEYGPRGVKKMGTIGLSILAGLPDETMQELLLWAYSAEQNPTKVDPAGAAITLASIITRAAEGDLRQAGVHEDKAPTFYVDRIIDPEIMKRGPKKSAS